MKIKQIISLCLVSIMSLSLVACGAIDGLVQPTAIPDDAVIQYVEKNKGGEAVSELIKEILFKIEDGKILSEEEKVTQKEIMDIVVASFASRSEMKILTSEVDKKTKLATVTAEISGVDMLSYYETFQSNINEILMEYIESLVSEVALTDEQLIAMDERISNVYKNAASDEKTKSYTEEVKFTLAYDKAEKVWKVTETSIPIESVIVGNLNGFAEFIANANDNSIVEGETDVEEEADSESEVSVE